ncbi:MAG: hypothetical protein ACTSP1_13910 [Candidatus Freyarchaeota archaeon]
MIDLFGLLRKMSTARYSDVRLIRQKLVEVALREKSADVFKQSQERVVCRAVSRGYGVASTNNLDAKSLEDISKLALKQASSRLRLRRVKEPSLRKRSSKWKRFWIS